MGFPRRPRVAAVLRGRGPTRRRSRHAALALLLSLSASPAIAQGTCEPVFYVSNIDSLPVNPFFDAIGAVSLRVDASGRPQVAYKLFYGPVRFASRTRTGWRVEIASPSDERNCCLMLDTTGDPHILYHAGILSRSGSTWSLNRHNLFFIEHACGVIASDGAVHAVVLQSFFQYNGVVSYVVVRGETWTEHQLDSRLDAWRNPNANISVRLDSKGVPRFCVTNTAPPQVRCWETPERPVPGSIPDAMWGSLAIDPQDVSHLAYYDTRARDLDYAVQGGGWSITAVDTTGDVGAYASLAVDRNGGAHLAYYDRGSQDLKYAYRPDVHAAWRRCVVDAPGDVGSWASLDVDADGDVHIAYWDATTRHVKYATTRAPVAVAPASWSRFKSAFR